MLRLARLLALTFAVLFAGTTVGLGFLSFTRKVATFERAGFTYERAGGTLVVTSVEPGGAAARAGLAPGDRIVTADGQSASSLAEPEKSLARPAFPHRLLAQHGEAEIREVLLASPRLVIDWKYLFLALVGLIYLSIGLFTLNRERTPAARVFWAICLSSFAINVLTNAGPHDTIWKAFWLTEDVYRALLPPLLLHFFLVFPASAVRQRWLTLAYLPGLVYLAVQEAPFLLPGLDAARTARTFQGATRLWYLLFALYGSAVVVRLVPLLKRHAGAKAEAEKQIRWIGLGVVVGLSPFLVFSALPEALGVAAPWLSKISLLPLILIPLAFCYAILKWRLWDVEIFIREALAATAAVLLCGMTFVLLNALLDRTLEGMAEAGKNVVAFGSGLILASLLVPMKKRITGVLERFQYHETYRARRALLDIARDFSTPRPQADLTAAIVERVNRGLHVVPCSLFRLEGADLEDSEAELLERHLAAQDVWRLRGPAFAPGTGARLYGLGYRSFFAMRCGGKLVGALGVGHKDGRVPLSSEDEALLVAVMAQAGLAYENARLYGALAERLEEIRTLQQYQESVIRSSSSGIAVLDSQDRLHLANPAFAALVGRPEQEILGLPFARVLPGVDLPAPTAGEPERALETRFVNASDEERNLRVSVSAFQGEPDHKVALVDDVTDRVRAERALAERERLASLGILAAGVAHEVNTPIAGLSSYAQLLLADTSPGDPRYEILKKMERQTFRAAHLVNNLLEYARPRTPARVRTDLHAVLESAAESVDAALGSRSLLVEVEGDREPVWVLADPRELEQVFVNLLSNARDVSPDSSPITCTVWQEAETARVAIADRGAGLPSGSREELFQPFFTTKKSGGTGLGLAISREIARRHGGDIRLEPREGGGACATVTLPLARTVS